MEHRFTYTKINVKDRFDHLLVLSRHYLKGEIPKFKKKMAYFNCLCDCGKNCTKSSRYLLDNRNTRVKKSCGCKASEYTRQKNKSNSLHNLSKDRRYIIWSQMKQRCYKTNHKHFDKYGGRGIKICDRWMEKNPQGFLNFIEDMGYRPDDSYPSGRSKYTIDRIDNDGDYEPSNCRWATYEQQWETRRKAQHENTNQSI